MANDVPQPKMFNSKKYRDNWEEIDWNPVRCYECGLRINRLNLKLHPDLYEVFSSGEIRHKNCNFN